MRYLKYILLILLLFCLTTVIYAGGTSLWDEENGNLFSDQQEYRKGDIIRVVINEDASAIQSANSSTSQDSDVGADTGTGILDFLLGFGFSYSDSGSADGETTRSGTLEANITTQITEVLDNGNLRIAGTKNIKINGEEQKIVLSGVIRPRDIELDNTISSKNVAEAKIEYEGEGPVAEKQRPGLLERLFNFIF